MHFSNKEFDFDLQEDNYLLRYKKQVPVAGTKFLDIPYDKLRNDFLEFRFEPDNEYDSNAIAIYLDDIKLGYVSKNSKINKMIHSYLNDDDWIVYGWLSMYHEVNKEIRYQVAFYKVFSEKDEMFAKKYVFNLAKKEEDFISYYENKQVSIEYDFDYGFEVLDEFGCKIGSLSKGDSNKIDHYYGECFDIYAYIDEEDLINIYIYKEFDDMDDEELDEEEYENIEVEYEDDIDEDEDRETKSIEPDNFKQEKGLLVEFLEKVATDSKKKEQEEKARGYEKDRNRKLARLKDEYFHVFDYVDKNLNIELDAAHNDEEYIDMLDLEEELEKIKRKDKEEQKRIEKEKNNNFWK